MSLQPPASSRTSGDEPQPASTTAPARAPVEVTPQMVLQILSTEHWSLLASRNLAWNEAFTRTGMFLSTLSFAIVALALVGQATGFGDEFRLFALIVLPVVLFIGVTTALRLDNANYHELLCAAGMNRIRARYLELAPGQDLERTFVMGTTDDLAGITLTVANAPGHGWVTDTLAATPALLAVLNSVLLGTIGALVLLQLGVDTTWALVVGVLAALVGFTAQALNWRRQFGQIVASYRPEYPAR